MSDLDNLLNEIAKCRVCAPFFDHEPRPVLRVHSDAKILIVGQAPGTRVHESGIPWDDPSGNKLRSWMGIEPDDFYNAEKCAIVPMGFCYPGKGKSGDLPPRPECAATWHKRVFAQLPNIELTILTGMYAQEYFLQDRRKRTLTETVANWEEYWPNFMVMPHPSPRNFHWHAKNPWFEADVIPILREKVQSLL